MDFEEKLDQILSNSKTTAKEKRLLDIANQLDHKCGTLYHRLQNIGPPSAKRVPLQQNLDTFSILRVHAKA